MSDADLYNLEFLSLVAKITQEIDNHAGINDKTLAEFVISLHDDSHSLPEFKQKLQDVGAGFPDSFVENVDRLILALHPKHKSKKAVADGGGSSKNGVEEGTIDELDKKKRIFPGLALKNQDWKAPETKDAIMKEVDDMMSSFEGAAKKARARPSEDERSPKRQRRSSRSRSPPPRRRSPSPPRNRGYDDRRDDRRGRNGDRGRSLDERPVLYKIYNGRISGLKEFGAFVQLEGIMGRAEGELAILCLFSEHH